MFRSLVYTFLKQQPLKCQPKMLLKAAQQHTVYSRQTSIRNKDIHLSICFMLIPLSIWEFGTYIRDICIQKIGKSDTFNLKNVPLNGKLL